jgi:hypothetical protein
MMMTDIKNVHMRWNGTTNILYIICKGPFTVHFNIDVSTNPLTHRTPNETSTLASLVKQSEAYVKI